MQPQPLQPSQPPKPFTDSDGYTYKDFTDRLLGRKEETGRNRAVDYAKKLGCSPQGVKAFVEAYDASKDTEGVSIANLNAGRHTLGLPPLDFSAKHPTARPSPPGRAGQPAAVTP